VVGKLLDANDPNLGFDAQTGDYVDMIKAGIIDPTKVVRLAYAPHTREGQKLIAHELAHTVQQSTKGAPVRVQRQPSDAGVPVADESYTKHVNCLARNGLGYGGMRSAGVITPDEIAQVNKYCREKEDTGYNEDIVPTDDENRQVLTGELVKREVVDELERAYLETVDTLAELGEPLDAEQIAALNGALRWLLVLGREPARTHFSAPSTGRRPPGMPVVGAAAATPLLGSVLALPLLGGAEGVGGAGLLAGEGVVGTGVLAGLGGIALGVVAGVIGVALVGLAAYGIYEFLKHGSRTSPSFRMRPNR
jgi:hypothetical protein